MYTIATEILKSDKDNTIQRVSCQKINNSNEIYCSFTYAIKANTGLTTRINQNNYE